MEGEVDHFEDVSRFSLTPRTLRVIDDAIVQARSELGLMERVRPDAQFFLLVNLHQMIALPLAITQPTGRELVIFEENVRQDVRMILETAREESRDEEVSAHAIVAALARSWEKLQLNKLEVWG